MSNAFPRTNNKRMTQPQNPSYRDLLEACRRDPPCVALVLGSGLGELADQVAGAIRVPFLEIPGQDAPTVAGHQGALLLGTWAGRRVLVFAGRLHFYEGYPWCSVEQPVLTARELGAEILLLTNAAGGIRADLAPGSVMAVRDHFEWTCPYGWRTPGPGERPSPYSPRLLAILTRAAQAVQLPLATGTYAQVTGPCYETPAEIRALRSLGADAVGMSTAREIARGHALGMACAALACITNRAAGLGEGPIQHEEVLAMGARIREGLARVVEGFLELVWGYPQ